MSSQISPCSIHDNSESKLFKEGKGGTQCEEVKPQKAISQKASLYLYLRIYPFSTCASFGSQISLCRFHEKSVRKLLPEVQVIPLWDELTDQKEVSQKASFRFWTDEISFISVGLNAIRKPFSGSSKTVLMDCSTKHKCNSVRWIHTSPRSFYERFFLVFLCGYFLCHRNVHCAMKFLIADLQKTVLTNW